MDATLGRAVRKLGYRRARALLLVVGLAVLVILALVTYLRRVETVEVIATLLFIPVFVSLMLWGPWGGALSGLAAAGVYVALRLPAIEAVGLDRFLGMIVSRTVGLVGFGLLGGWAVRQLQGSIRKLELYDQVDDATGLLNAHFFLEETDLEMSRSARYRSVFSVGAVEVPTSAFDGMPRRRARRALRDLARETRRSIRVVDRAVHATDGSSHVLTVILPETGPEGAEIFTTRMVERTVRHLGSEGRLGPEQVRSWSWTFPEDEEALRAFRERIRGIDAQERPTEAPADNGERPGSPERT